MTALCPGGVSSSAKVGQAEIVMYGAGSIASILNNRGAFWAAVVAPLMGVLTLDLNAMCTTDPPAIPSFTAADVTEMLAFGGTLASPATRTKFADLVTNFLWWQLCECNGATTPAPPAAPAPPAGLPDATNLYNGTGIGFPCVTASASTHADSGTNVFTMFGNTNINGDANFLVTPSTVTHARVTSSMTPEGANHCTTWRVTLRWFSPTGASVRNDAGAQHPPDGNLYTDDFTAPAVPLGFLWGEIVGTPFGNGSDAPTMRIDLYCGGAPGSQQVPCCPADQFQTAAIQQILEYVQLLQRQLVPFAHIGGAVHSGLTGQGTLTVNGLLGIKVDLTTIPASYGSAVGSPEFHFDLGWVSVLTPDGLIDERRLSAQLVNWFPRLMSDATVIGYSLSPGVVATITEVLREP